VYGFVKVVECRSECFGSKVFESEMQVCMWIENYIPVAIAEELPVVSRSKY
jgi:hypothetical protein